MSPPRHRVAGVVVLVAAIAVAGLLILRAGDDATAPRAPASVEAGMRARLAARGLEYRWMVCTPDRGITRCNVDFGPPHIVQYCATLRGGRLVTDRDDPALRCGRRQAGGSPDAQVDRAAVDAYGPAPSG